MMQCLLILKTFLEVVQFQKAWSFTGFVVIDFTFKVMGTGRSKEEEKQQIEDFCIILEDASG